MMENTCKILEYKHVKNGISYRVYDLYDDPDKYIDSGMLNSLLDVIAYCDVNNVREYFDVTYRMVW